MAKYLKSKQIGNKGEAFFENLVSENAIAHKIDTSKDIGLDFLCEWVHNEKPTHLFFGVQVKTRSNKKIKLLDEKRCNRNLLMKYGCSFKIKEKTLKYWEGFDFPIFLFFVNISGKNGEDIDCFYKRYTPVLHNTNDEEKEVFYKVNDKNNFFAFVRKKDFCGGFCRDLYMDHLRCQHNKGILSGINPQDLGLNYWNKDVLYKGVFDDYKEQIRETFCRYNKFKSLFE